MSRRSGATCARKRAVGCAPTRPRSCIMADIHERAPANWQSLTMTVRRTTTQTRWFPAVLGFGSVIVVVLLIELLIRRGLINRFIVPLPSDIMLALPRVIIEENVLSRFLLTAAEAFSA